MVIYYMCIVFFLLLVSIELALMSMAQIRISKLIVAHMTFVSIYLAHISVSKVSVAQLYIFLVPILISYQL